MEDLASQLARVFFSAVHLDFYPGDKRVARAFGVLTNEEWQEIAASDPDYRLALGGDPWQTPRPGHERSRRMPLEAVVFNAWQSLCMGYMEMFGLQTVTEDMVAEALRRGRLPMLFQDNVCALAAQAEMQHSFVHEILRRRAFSMIPYDVEILAEACVDAEMERIPVMPAHQQSAATPILLGKHTWVTLHGLKTHDYLNGKLGKVQSRFCSKGDVSYGIEMHGGYGTKKVKAANVVIVPPDECVEVVQVNFHGDILQNGRPLMEQLCFPRCHPMFSQAFDTFPAHGPFPCQVPAAVGFPIIIEKLEKECPHKYMHKDSLVPEGATYHGNIFIIALHMALDKPNVGPCGQGVIYWPFSGGELDIDIGPCIVYRPTASPLSIQDLTVMHAYCSWWGNHYHDVMERDGFDADKMDGKALGALLRMRYITPDHFRKWVLQYLSSSSASGNRPDVFPPHDFYARLLMALPSKDQLDLDHCDLLPCQDIATIRALRCCSPVVDVQAAPVLSCSSSQAEQNYNATEERDNRSSDAPYGASESEMPETLSSMTSSRDLLAGFLGEVLFWTPEDVLVAAARLRVNDFVRADTGRPLRVIAIKEHPPAERTLVELVASDACVTVTEQQRVLVMRGGTPQHAPAFSLKPFMRVSCSGGAIRELQSVRMFRRVTAIYEIRFDPDEALGAFIYPHVMVPSSTIVEQPDMVILLKGHGWSQTRRAGMNRRGLARQDAEDCVSVPDTDAPLTLKLDSLVGSRPMLGMEIGMDRELRDENIAMQLRAGCGTRHPQRQEKGQFFALVAALRASLARWCSRRLKAD